MKRPFWPASCHLFLNTEKSTAKMCKNASVTLNEKVNRSGFVRNIILYDLKWADLTLTDLS